MPDPKPDDVDFHEETTDPLVADVRELLQAREVDAGRNEG
jgi:hypothetical protein